MKKLLALILIFPIFISADDVEYPIELTCELVVPIYVSYDPVNKMGTIEFVNQLEYIKKDIYEIKHIGIGVENAANGVDEDTANSYQFSFKAKGKLDRLVNHAYFYINRNTLQAYLTPPASNAQTFTGKCFKGFKEYTEKKI
jgi:hypothetical protein